MDHSRSFKVDDFITSFALADMVTAPEATLHHWRKKGFIKGSFVVIDEMASQRLKIGN